MVGSSSGCRRRGGISFPSMIDLRIPSGVAFGQLGPSETTVKTHVSQVLEKLELRDRVQAGVFADENGLVAPGTD